MNTRVNLAGVLLKNPIMTASGTFGSGQEYSEFVDLNKLGAVVTKGVANVPWPGNPTPRVAEVYGGMLNAIGLQNPGIDVFVQRDIPFLTHYDTRIIVNVCGKTASDYIEVVERLAEQPVDMLEINISCPNVKEGGIAFGQNAASVEEITKEVKKYARQPVIMKLSPNVTDITEIKGKDGKLYTSVIFDCFDLAPLGISMDTNMKAELCVETVKNAVKSYPELRGAILHSDRGSQYTIEKYRETLKHVGLVQSMNSTGGRCHDNALCESMWARMKEELFYSRNRKSEDYTVAKLKTIPSKKTTG